MKKILTSHFSSLILFLILIIASFLRLYNITAVPPGLYPDEAMNGNNALEAIATGQFKIFYPENNGREGLFINIQALSLKIFGNEPWALRVVSAIFGILTVLGVYFLAKELFAGNLAVSFAKRISTGFQLNFNTKVALLSSFLLATSFWHINFSRIGFRAIMAPFFLTWAIYFLLKSLQITNPYKYTNSYDNSSKLYILNSILSGLLFGLGFHSYIAYRGLPLLILVILILYWFKIKREASAELHPEESRQVGIYGAGAKLARKRFLLVACLFLLSTFIVFLPLGLYFLENPGSFFGRTAQVSIFNSLTPLKDLGRNILKTAGMFNFRGDGNWRHNVAGRPLLFWPVGILFLIGVFMTIKALVQNSKIKSQNNPEQIPSELYGAGNSKFKNNFAQQNTEIFNFAFCILISWIVIATLPVVISNEGLPHALRAIIMIPPVFILAGIGGIWLYQGATNYQFFTNIQMRFAIYALLFTMLAFEVYTAYFVRWAQNPNVQGAFSADYAKIGYELRLLPKELRKYVIVEASGIPVRGIPMPAQTVMFLTDTFTPEKQKEKNIYYVLPQNESQIPAGVPKVYLR